VFSERSRRDRIRIQAGRLGRERSPDGPNDVRTHLETDGRSAPGDGGHVVRPRRTNVARVVAVRREPRRAGGPTPTRRAVGAPRRDRRRRAHRPAVAGGDVLQRHRSQLLPALHGRERSRDEVLRHGLRVHARRDGARRGRPPRAVLAVLAGDGAADGGARRDRRGVAAGARRRERRPAVLPRQQRAPRRRPDRAVVGHRRDDGHRDRRERRRPRRARVARRGGRARPRGGDPVGAPPLPPPGPLLAPPRR